MGDFIRSVLGNALIAINFEIVDKFGGHLRYILAAEAYTDKRLLSLVLRVNSLSRYTVRDDQLPAPACCDLLAPDLQSMNLGRPLDAKTGVHQGRRFLLQDFLQLLLGHRAQRLGLYLRGSSGLGA